MAPGVYLTKLREKDYYLPFSHNEIFILVLMVLIQTFVSVRMQRVHKVFRIFFPSSYTVTFCKFGLNLRLVVFFDQGRLCPNFVVFPHVSHLAITSTSFKSDY